MVPPGSDLIGRPVTGVQLFKRDGVRLVDVLRDEISLRRNLQDVCLMTGGRVVLRSQVSELLSLQRDKILRRVDQHLGGGNHNRQGVDYPGVQDDWATCVCGAALESILSQYTGEIKILGSIWKR